MLRCSGVPLLPGSTFKDISKTHFHKSHHWDHYRGVPILADATRPGIGGEPLNNPDDPPHQFPSLYPPYASPKLPSWLTNDKKVLCFHGYFKETLQEVYLAPYLVRKVKILFYLEDGTMQVSEPKTDNSGIPQGCLVTRQRIPRPPPCQNEFLSVLDLNVNQLVRIFDRVYHITGCDLFTRHFLNRLGISVSDPVESPNDPGTEIRNKQLACKQPKKPSVRVDTLAQFLQNDRKVLRFTAYWDDREAEFGDVRDLMVYFFLSDDTMQIKEVLGRNSGRDSGGKFLKRCKLPKDFPGLPRIGEESPYTVLNVMGGGLKGARYMTDSLNVGNRKIDFYTERDLTIGTTINVFSRAIVITGCDDFTKEFYRIKYGLEDFSQVQKPYQSVPVCIELYDRELPPFNGWGTHEDSQGNCKTVEPKPPKADFNKFIKLDGYLLRFGAKMLSHIKENTERIFIITYFLSDDTISVYELAVRNSGFLGGDFYKRTKFILPNQDILTSKVPLQYIPQHFFIGATLLLKDFKFHLVSADEFALAYMEQKSNEFPYSNVKMIMSKVREAIKPIYKNFIASQMVNICNTSNTNGNSISVICYDAMSNALIELLGDKIIEHEIITLCRYLSAEKKQPTTCEREKVRSVVHLELKRMLWDNIDRLREHLYHLDPLNNGFMPENKILCAIRACRLPLEIELIKNMFSVLFKDHNCNINVCDFVDFVDVTKSSCPIQPLNVKRDVCPVVPFTEAGRLVDWNFFIEQLGLEEELKNATN